jgi:2,3-bisphosphoglycerate-independent phosphoglycerate mutase
MKTPYLLCILDGFGLNPSPIGNAIAQARKPSLDRLMAECPNATLVTHGERVGLPEGQMGNSEVGHLNIGAGRVVEQSLLRISRALAGDYLDRSAEFKNFLRATNDAKAIHLIGLFSDGGVHSHSEHLYLMLRGLHQRYQGKIVVHLITDGRDTSPHRAGEQVAEIQQLMKELPRLCLGSIIGRFYAMDRDKRWDRVEQGYKTIVLADAPHAEDPAAWIKSCYARGITDEFLDPAVISACPVDPSDGVIFYNFRADRARELLAATCLQDFPHFKRPVPPFAPEKVLCFCEYDASYNLPVLFPAITVSNHLGELLSGLGLTQFRTAETEKYPHVTYFFNGGIEKQYPGEERQMVPSPREVKTYDLKPEMSAFAVKDLVVAGLLSGKYDLIVVNFANCDMVGHTGVIPAAIKAVETVDTCVGEIYAALLKMGGKGLIIADHGNADHMLNRDGSTNTEHSLNPVPVIMPGADKQIKLASDGSLCDVAPTLLKMMGLKQPADMTGHPLYQES